MTVLSQTVKFTETTQGFIATPHLRALGQFHADPVAVAEGFLHVPYLWGGNSRVGIDCSGLVQISLAACGIKTGGDADLQQNFGQELAEGAPLQRGDLIFWKGHVAMVVDDTRLIHANGHTMSVAYEGITACIDRILTSEGLVVSQRRRP